MLFSYSTGYGHITPKTYYGQFFSVIYALIGIPICGILLAALGDRFNKWKDKILEKVYLNFDKKWQRKLVSLITITGGGMVLFIFIPSAIFHAQEGWSYHDALYFCYITLTTVGFGDFVPGKKKVNCCLFLLVCVSVYVLKGYLIPFMVCLFAFLFIYLFFCQFAVCLFVILTATIISIYVALFASGYKAL